MPRIILILCRYLDMLVRKLSEDKIRKYKFRVKAMVMIMVMVVVRVRVWL